MLSFCSVIGRVQALSLLCIPLCVFCALFGYERVPWQTLASDLHCLITLWVSSQSFCLCDSSLNCCLILVLSFLYVLELFGMTTAPIHEGRMPITQVIYQGFWTLSVHLKWYRSVGGVPTRGWDSSLAVKHQSNDTTTPFLGVWSLKLISNCHWLVNMRSWTMNFQGFRASTIIFLPKQPFWGIQCPG